MTPRQPDEPAPSNTALVHVLLVAIFATLFLLDREIGLIALLVAFSGLFSGLTIGILGLSEEDLEIEMNMGNTYARAILPVRRNGNLVLSTLLVANVVVNSALSIFLSEISSGVVGGLVSIALITVFGEILPQSFAVKHGLRMGYYTLPLLRLALALFYPVTKPVALLLDRLVGDALPAIRSKRKLSKMLEYIEDRGIIDRDEKRILLGGVSFSDKRVSDVMTPIDEAFMLPEDAVLTDELLHSIYTAGYSRIPIYGKDRRDVVGLLYAKKLAIVNPEDETPVSEMMSREVPKIMASEQLDGVLNKFKLKKRHLFVVYHTDSDAEGIITLEDILERIIGDIEDETDDPKHELHAESLRPE